jgi:hypothetical protein
MDGKRIRKVDKEKLRKKFKDTKKQNLKGKKRDKRQGNRSKLKLEHDSINKEGLKKYCVLEKYCFQVISVTAQEWIYEPHASMLLAVYTGFGYKTEK